MGIFSQGCVRDDKALLEAARDLAPLGGTGKKDFQHDYGGKLIQHWKDYEIVRNIYLDANNEVILDNSIAPDGKIWGLKIDTKSGEIQEFLQFKRLGINGVRIKVDKGKITEISVIESTEESSVFLLSSHNKR